MRSPDHTVAAHDRDARLDLVLTPSRITRGYAYEWQDGDGRVWMSGFCLGTKAEVRRFAIDRLTATARRVA